MPYHEEAGQLGSSGHEGPATSPAVGHRHPPSEASVLGTILQPIHGFCCFTTAVSHRQCAGSQAISVDRGKEANTEPGNCGVRGSRIITKASHFP